MPDDLNRHSESDEDSTETHESKVRNALINRGLHLELSTYMTLKRRGWTSRLHSLFWDIEIPKEGNSWVHEIRQAWEGPLEVVHRAIDLVATRTINPESSLVSSFQIKLVIECKHRSDENWVFYQENQDHEISIRIARAFIDELRKLGAPKVEADMDHLSLQEYSSFMHLKYSEWRDFLDSSDTRSIRGASHHANKTLKRVAILHTPVFGPRNLDNIRNACEQVLGACDFQDKMNEVIYLTNLENPSNILHWRIYPVVVFDGPLWDVSLDEGGDLQPSPLKWVTYLYTRRGKGHLIDIVGSEHLEAYLSAIENELK